MKELLTYSQELSSILKAANKNLADGVADAQTVTVAIKEQGNDKAKYSAKMKLDGDWIEELPAQHPDEKDVYWLRFKENVNKTREERKEITNKAIEVAGNSISKVVNPISFSPVDITNLIKTVNDTIKK
jgi:hypothetical protein